MNTHRLLTRRDFLSTSAAAIAAATLPSIADDKAAAPEPIIDIHQHTNFSGRTDSQLIAHQRAMGITTTILLPAGRNVNRPSTHNGSSNGLAAKCTGNEACYHVAEENPKEFMFGSNEVPDIEDAIPEI